MRFFKNPNGFFMEITHLDFFLEIFSVVQCSQIKKKRMLRQLEPLILFNLS